MNEESKTASTDTESESQFGITGSTQDSISTQGHSSTRVGSSTQGISLSQGSSYTQGTTQDDPTPPSLTPTVSQRRRGHAIVRQ